MDDPASLVDAVAGSYAVFAVTNCESLFLLKFSALNIFLWNCGGVIIIHRYLYLKPQTPFVQYKIQLWRLAKFAEFGFA